MSAYEKKLQAQTAERVRIAKSGGDVQAYLRNQRNANLTAAAKAETQGKDYQTAHKAVETPALDAAVGNVPEFTTTKTEDFVAPSTQKRQLTNEEQALEIMGLLNPVDFSPEAVAEREWEKAGVKNAEEYRKALPGLVQKDVNDLKYFFEEGALLAAESGLANTVSSLAEAGRAINDFVTKPTPFTEALSAGYAPYVDKSKDVSKKVGDYLLGFADEQAQSSQGAMDIAKSNVNGTVGEVLLDATAAGSQMVGDIVISGATGGSTKIPMALRSFGAGVQDARNKGYTPEQQIALGLSSAAIEYVTEKFFGGNPFYDKAEAGLVNKFIAQVSNNKDLLAFLSSTPVETLNEGLEEILSGVLNPAMEYIIAGQADPIVLEDLLKEGLIGVMLGGAGQVANAAYNKKDAAGTTEESSEPESPLLVQQEQKAEAPAASDANEGVQEYTPIQKDYGRIANDVLRDPELLAWYESKFGTLTGSNTQKAKTIASTLARDDLAHRSQQMERDATAGQILAEADAIRAEQEALNSRTPEQAVIDLLKDGSQSAVNSIIRNSDYQRAFSALTKTDLSGMSNNEKRNAISAYLSLVQSGVQTLPKAPASTSSKSNPLYDALVGSPNPARQAPPIQTQEQKAEPPAVSSLIVEGTPIGVNPALAEPGTPSPTPSNHGGPVNLGEGPFHPINKEGAAQANANFGRKPIQVPKKNFDGYLTSKTSSTIMNSGVTPNAVAQSIADALTNGGMARLALSDAEAMLSARKTIANKGFDKALEDFHADVINGQRGKKLTAVGMELFNQASLEGRVMDAASIAADIIEASTEQAQAVQVLHLFNKATPEGRFYFAVKGIDNVISRMEQKYGDRASDISVDEGLLADYYEAVRSGDEQTTKEKWQEVEKDIAAQIPPNWSDMLTAWRYLAMLGNPKTHIRNMAGNVAFMPVRMMKNAVGAVAESVSGTDSRTKAILNPLNAQDRQLMQMAWQDYADAMDGSSTSRYDEATNDIDRMRKVLPGKLDNLAKANASALAKEDQWFSQPAYAGALAGWLKANGITAQQYAAMLESESPNARSVTNLRELKPGETVHADDRGNYGKVVANNGDGTYKVHFVAENGSEATVSLSRAVLRPTNGKNGTVTFNIAEATPAEIVAEARSYAKREAKKATFQDSNALSDAVARAGRSSKGARFLMDAVLPFKRTPANVLMRGIEYSPVYLAKGIGEMAFGVRSGKVSASEAIDHFASGFVGSAILGAGFLLAKSGVLRASGDDDDKQAAFDALQGKQDYSLTFGNDSFTIDWASPVVLPLFVGAEVYNLMSKEGNSDDATTEDYINALIGIADPILETSMLSGVNDLINSVGYSDDGFGAIARNIAMNYIGSFLPTFGGQIERIGDTSRSETYRYNDSDHLKSGGQRELGSLLNKVPGKDYGQIDYIDAWGRTQDYSDNPLLRGLNQLANPSYISAARVTEVDDELQRLYDAGQKAVLPQRRSQSDTVAVRDAEGNIIEERHLTAEEYEQYNRTKGQTSLELVSQLMDSGLYASMNDDEKAKAIENIYSYATAVANLEAEPTTKVDSWVKKAKESSDPGKYIQLYSAAQNLEPYGDNKSVSTWQKVELVSKNTNTKQADEFIPLYLEGNNPTKYEMARERGYSPERFVEAYTAMNTMESDRDESGESLGNVRKKVIAHLVSLGWPEANAEEMYKLFRADSGDIKNWTW